MLRNIITIGILACLIVVASPLWAQSQEKEGEHMGAEQRVVRIGANNLAPASLNVKAGEVVAWINYSGVPLQISFSKEAVEKILCKEPTRFHLAGDGSLTSGAVRPFEAAALCSFLPGEYHYSVRRQFTADVAKAVKQESSGHIAVAEKNP